MWMIVTVETELEWPAEETSVSFMGHTLILRPPDGDDAADVRLQYEHPESQLEAFETICRLLTALSWWHHRPARIRLRIDCTSPMRGGNRGGGGYGPPLCKKYQLPKAMQLPADFKARMALALYREALSVQNPIYEFLGYFKIVNVYHRTPTAQIRWINCTLCRLTDRTATQRISALACSESDIGDYLYHSGRCAAAHGSGRSTVDPDKPDDVFRLGSDMPVAKALAEYLIERELGMPWIHSR